MARILHYTTETSRTFTRIDAGRVMLLAAQYAVLGAIALFIVLAVVNTVFGIGAGAESPGYTAYEAS